MDNIFNMAEQIKDDIYSGKRIPNDSTYHRKPVLNPKELNLEFNLSEERLLEIIEEYGDLNTARESGCMRHSYPMYSRGGKIENEVQSNLLDHMRIKFGDVVPSGLFWVKKNGWVGWHTNSKNLGDRYYLVWTAEDNKSFFRWRDTKTGKIHTKWEKKGWQINKFKSPDWHCVGSYTDRISIGFMGYEPTLSGGHICDNKDYGDWRIREKSDENSFLNLTEIEYLLTNDKIETISFDDIAWKGRDFPNKYRKLRCICCDGLRYRKCDVKYPGILVKDAPNPYDLRYRMIDGKHRIEKLLNEGYKKWKFYVIECYDFMKHLKIKEEINK
tara:strand:- start:77 stop:1060 length:984 start_codon:yes stop_codon:yes gene_type:complete